MKYDDSRKFSLAVKIKLLELNMTQRKLARELNINENYLTDILRGRKPGLKYRSKILEELNIVGDEFR